MDGKSFMGENFSFLFYELFFFSFFFGSISRAWHICCSPSCSVFFGSSQSSRSEVSEQEDRGHGNESYLTAISLVLVELPRKQQST